MAKHLEACMEIASRHGIPEPIVSLRKMRTRWSSCSNKGRITLSLHLIQVPVHCIDDAIMHKLHLLLHSNLPSPTLPLHARLKKS